MLGIYDRVKVKETGETGTIIDVNDSTVNGKKMYTVESDTQTQDAYGTLYPQIFCKEEEIEPL